MPVRALIVHCSRPTVDGQPASVALFSRSASSHRRMRYPLATTTSSTTCFATSAASSRFCCLRPTTRRLTSRLIRATTARIAARVQTWRALRKHGRCREHGRVTSVAATRAARRWMRRNAVQNTGTTRHSEDPQWRRCLRQAMRWSFQRTGGIVHARAPNPPSHEAPPLTVVAHTRQMCMPLATTRSPLRSGSAASEASRRP